LLSLDNLLQKHYCKSA